jgi:hypothetical protein
MVTAALVLAASSARADDDRADREAEARFSEGLARVKGKDFEAARLSFAQAYAVLHRPLILWNLALSEEKTDHPVDALVHFRQVAREAPSDADRANAQRHVDALAAQLSRVDVQAPPGTVLALDGTAIAGTAPLASPLDVTPGHHVVGATLASGATKSIEVDAASGQLAHVTFAADASPAPLTATLPAGSAAPAAPVSPAPAAALPTDVPPPRDDSRAPFWTPRTVTATVFVGAAVVAGGAAAALGIASQNNKSAVTRYQNKYPRDYCNVPAGTAAPSDCVPWNDAVNAQNRDANISNALYFTAGALALGAVVSWFFWPKAGHTKAAWVLPEVGPQAAGVEAGGRF